MKRIVMYTLVLTAALLLPHKGTDIGRLKPVGLVQIYREAGLFVIVTDTGDSGVGTTAAEAFRNLEDTTSGVIFLDTADYLLVDESAVADIAAMYDYLKKSAGICRAGPEIDPVDAALYLGSHRPAVKLKEYKPGEFIEELKNQNGKMILENIKKDEKSA